MALPSVKIVFENGALGSVTPSDDGVVGLIASGIPTESIGLGEAKLLTSLKDLEDLGIVEVKKEEKKKTDNQTIGALSGDLEEFEEGEEFEEFEEGEEETTTTGEEETTTEQGGRRRRRRRRRHTSGNGDQSDSEELSDLDETEEEPENNNLIYTTVKEFYSEAPTGAKLWLMIVSKEVTVTQMFEDGYAQRLIESAKGTINLLITKKGDDKNFEPEREAEGIGEDLSLEADVYTAMSAANDLAKRMTDDKFAPFFVLLEGRYYNGDAGKLINLGTYENNRVGILIADTDKNSTGACVGLLAGRIAAIPVQRSIARVKTGAISANCLYIAGKPAEDGKPDIINDNGYITARTFIGKAGYYWSDDKLATKDDDDYALIPRRRIIDKAYRIAYKTLVEEIGEEIPVTDEGEISAPIAKSIQNKVERAIENNMTAFGNLGNDPGNPSDTGVMCYINPKQNIMANSRLEIQLKVKPYAYAKYINVFLGFKTVSA